MPPVGFIIHLWIPTFYQSGHDTIATCGHVDVVLGADVVKVCVHVVGHCAAVCQRCWH